MANDTPNDAPELPQHQAPAVSGIPTDPQELEAWKAQFTEDLVHHPHDDWSQRPVHKPLRRDRE